MSDFPTWHDQAATLNASENPAEGRHAAPVWDTAAEEAAWAEVNLAVIDTPRAADETPTAGASAPARVSKDKRAARDRDRTLIRKTLQKVDELAHVREQQVKIAAAILGQSSVLTTDIVMAIMTSTPRELVAATDCLAIIAAESELEAGVTATTIGRPRLRNVWRVLSAMGIVWGEMPASDAKAGIAVVTNLRETPEGLAKSEIEQALELIRH